MNQLYLGFKVPTKSKSFSVKLKTSIYIQNSTQNKILIMTCILFHFLRFIVHCLLNYRPLTNKRVKAFLYKISQFHHSPIEYYYFYKYPITNDKSKKTLFISASKKLLYALKIHTKNTLIYYIVIILQPMTLIQQPLQIYH